MECYELIIKDETDEVFAISLVDKPAIERDWIFFSKEETQFATIDNSKHLLVGAILIPDLKILRLDEITNTNYEVFFSKETTKQLAQNYIMRGYQDKSTLQHKINIKDVYLVESWIVDNPIKDKSNFYNLTLPEGSWCGVFKVNNDDIWNDYVKTGKVKGFSVEVNIDRVLRKMNILDKELKDITEEEFDEFLKKMKEK